MAWRRPKRRRSSGSGPLVHRLRQQSEVEEEEAATGSGWEAGSDPPLRSTTPIHRLDFFLSFSTRTHSNQPRLSTFAPASASAGARLDLVRDSSDFGGSACTAAGSSPLLAAPLISFRSAAQRRCVAAAAQWIRAARRDKLHPAAGFFEQRPVAARFPSL